jgi:hypothetical protein
MNDIASAERAVLGTLIELNGDCKLAAPLAQLLAHAPECWDDLRHGQIAVAIRELKLNHQAVHPLAVLEHVDFDGKILYISEVSNAALPEYAAALEADTIWQRYRIRRTRSLFAESVEHLEKNPDLSRSIVSNVRASLDSLDDENHNDGLPDMIDAADFLTRDLPEPKQVVCGLLHRGSKMAIGGGSKSFKTWNLVNLAVAAQSGSPWLKFETTPSKVLFCNFEIHPFSWQRRIAAVAQARGLTVRPGQLILWNLRGHAANYQALLPKIARACREHAFDLIIIDPIYKLYGNAKENAAEDIALLLNTVDELITQSGAAVAFGSHFSKGNQSTKESIDRFSGSGVFARDPDSLLTMTRHEEDGAFTIESTLRNFPPVDPFVVRWHFPLMELDDHLDPAKLKQPAGRKSDHSPDDLLTTLGTQSMTTSDWRKAAENDAGIKERSFYRLKRQLSESGEIFQSRVNGSWQRVSKR